MGKELLGSSPSLYDVPFLQNVVLQGVVEQIKVDGNFRGPEMLPNFDVATRKTEWEVEYGARTIAPIVAHDAASPLGKRAGADRKSAELVDIREKFFLDEDTILFLRMLGERESTRRKGAEAQVAEDIAELKGRVETRLEQMRWNAVVSGRLDETITVDGKALRYFIDYGVPSTQFVDATDSGWGGAWTTPGTARPKLTFQKAQTTVREATGRRVKFAWMNTNTHNVLDEVSGLHTDWRSQESAPQDLVKSEHLTDIVHNIRIIDYDEGHFDRGDVNGTGTFRYFIPNNKVIYTVGATDGGQKYGDMAVGPSLLATGAIQQGIFAESWYMHDPTREYCRVGVIAVPRIMQPEWTIVATINA